MVECKRYVQSRLSERELIGELHLARDNGCDLWVLAATCEVPEQSATKLQAAAETLGFVTLLLDWPDGQIKPLLILLAGAPGATGRHLGAAVAGVPPRSASISPARPSLSVTIIRSYRYKATGALRQ